MLRLLKECPYHLREAYFQSAVILLLIEYFVAYCVLWVMDGTSSLLGYNNGISK